MSLSSRNKAGRRQGLWKYDPATRKFTQVVRISSNPLRRLWWHKGRIVGTVSRRFYQVDPGKGTLRLFMKQPYDGFSSRRPFALTGEMLFAGSEELHAKSLRGSTAKALRAPPGGRGFEGMDFIVSLQSHRGKLLLATAPGDLWWVKPADAGSLQLEEPVVFAPVKYDKLPPHLRSTSSFYDRVLCRLGLSADQRAKIRKLFHSCDQQVARKPHDHGWKLAQWDKRDQEIPKVLTAEQQVKYRKGMVIIVAYASRKAQLTAEQKVADKRARARGDKAQLKANLEARKAKNRQAVADMFTKLDAQVGKPE